MRVDFFSFEHTAEFSFPMDDHPPALSGPALLGDEPEGLVDLPAVDLTVDVLLAVAHPDDGV